MVSLPARDPQRDHLLTPENAALLIIDYQPPQIFTVRSMPTGQLVNNIIALAKLAQAFALPTVLSTVNVGNGVNPDTIPQLRREIADLPSYDRTQINAWEDREFREAVAATGRRKLLIAALWTEACLLFPTLDALREGYDVYPVVDALGGTTRVAHETAVTRVVHAGAQPTTWNSVACELQRDWARTATVEQFLQITADENEDWGWYEELRGRVRKGGELTTSSHR